MASKAAALILALLVGCVGQAPVSPEPPTQVDIVAYAIRHSVLLDPPGCTGIEVQDGIVVTAKHCIEDDDVVGNPFGDPAAAGKIAWISADHDAVIVEYPRLRREAERVRMRDYVIGEHVFVVGYPVQLRSDKQELTITDGLMAGPVDSEGTARTTAEAYFGNSGGGVWGEDGALLGVLVSINAAPGLPGAPMPYPAQTYMVPIKFVIPAL
jgi:S1-C subfamily serine protease